MGLETKIVAYSPVGGKGTMISMYPYGASIGGGAKRLSQTDMEHWQKAKLMASHVNGGSLTVAKEYLEKQGWEVFWDGAPEDLSERFQLRLSESQLEYVKANGGSDFIRSLVMAHRERQEAQSEEGK